MKKPNIFNRLMLAFRAFQLKAYTGGLVRGKESTPQRIPDIAADGRYAYAKNPYVATCVNRIAEAVSQVPLKIYTEIEVDGKPDRQEVLDGELYNLLSHVNDFDTSTRFWRATSAEFTLMQNAFWVCHGPNRSGPPTSLEIVPWENIEIVPAKDGRQYIEKYNIRINGREISLTDTRDIIHFRGINPMNNLYLGFSPGEILVNPILLNWYIERWNIEFFKRGATLGGVLSTDQGLSPDQVELAKEQWVKKQGGTDNAWRPAILQQGLQFQSTTPLIKDMGFEILTRMIRETILGLYGVPPAVAGIMEYANYANAKEQNRQFWKVTVIPQLRYFASVINEIMIRRFWPDMGWYVEYDISTIEELQEDALQRAQRDQIHVNTGIKTVNEVRAEMNLEPVEWGEEPPSAPSPFGGALSGPQPMFKFNRKGELSQKRIAEIEIWNRFDKKLKLRESLMRKVAREFFVAQGCELRKYFDEQYKSIKEPPKPVDIEKVLEILFILMQQLKLRELTQATIEQILAQAGGEALRGVGAINMSFNVTNPLVTQWIEQNTLDLVTTVHQASKDELRQMLVDAHESGASIQETSKEIGQLFDGWADYRSDRIARTETIKAHNKGAVEGYRQSDLVEGKEWLTAPGAENPRHELMVIEPVALDAPFNVDGYLMDFPADPNGPAEHVINCRCTVVPILKEG